MSCRNKLFFPSFSSSLLISIADFFSTWQGTILLQSGGKSDSAQYSFLSLFPFKTVALIGKTLTVKEGQNFNSKMIEHPWEALESNFFSYLAQDPTQMSFGWLGYGMGAYADQDLILPYRESTFPDAYWQLSSVVLVYDHLRSQAEIFLYSNANDLIDENAQEWVKKFSTEQGWGDFFEKLSEIAPIEMNCFSTNLTKFSEKRKSAYVGKVKKAQELICDGEIYQVNLSQKFDFHSPSSHFSLYKQLFLKNPSPFSAFLSTEYGTIVSTSPERFLNKKGKVLETRPIKGTIKRGESISEDNILKNKLLNSEKERAELLMITDLMRNDLGKVSEVGSVVVKELWKCESYSNVFHMLSIIQSVANESLKPLEIVRACFPGGSITGCPKLRSMQVIDELEDSSRGIYTGSIGYFTGSGDFDLNIAIRTLFIKGNTGTLHLGSGIVYDSKPEKEYEETLVKGATFFQFLQNKVT